MSESQIDVEISGEESEGKKRVDEGERIKIIESAMEPERWADMSDEKKNLMIRGFAILAGMLVFFLGGVAGMGVGVVVGVAQLISLLTKKKKE